MYESYGVDLQRRSLNEDRQLLQQKCFITINQIRKIRIQGFHRALAIDQQQNKLHSHFIYTFYGLIRWYSKSHQKHVMNHVNNFILIYKL